MLGTNVSTVAGNGSAGYVDGVGTLAMFSFPRGIAMDGAGSIGLVVSGWSECIKLITHCLI